MFSVKRVPEGEPTRISIETPKGSVLLTGDADFCQSIWADVCRNEIFAEALREGFQGETKESVAEKLREAGFPENVVTDFMNA